MNERIKELAEQAFDKANNGTIYDIKIPKEFIEKYAELIVKECADLANEHNEEAEGVHLGVGRAIKEHFGIEEEYRPPVQETHCPHDILLDKYCKKCDDEVSNQLELKNE